MELADVIESGIVQDIYGRKFSLDIADLAALQDKVDIPDEFKPFLSVNDVIRFMGSPKGMDISLEQAAAKHDPSVNAAVLRNTLTDMQRGILLAEIINAYVGQPDMGPKSDPPLKGGPHRMEAPFDPAGETGS